MLQRNKLITRADSQRLERWIDAIDSVVLNVLAGHPSHYRLSRYAEYVSQVGWWDNINFFIPLLERAVADADLLEASTEVEALGALGGIARSALPTLYQALARRYTYYTPEDRCTEEMRGTIQRAIDRIEAAPPGG